MNKYKNLYKSIDELNNKIKKLETNKKLEINKKLYETNIESYKINYPTDTDNHNINKKYLALLFNSNNNNYDSDNSSTNKKLYPFIKLKKSNIIINYFIQIELNSTPLSSIICSLFFGIKSKSDSKVKIIKGTKYQFDLNTIPIINNKITISNTILYIAENNEELCIITDFSSYCNINNNKSIIKILYL